jgi:hypothetical protein
MKKMKYSRQQCAGITQPHKEYEIHDIQAPYYIISHPCDDMAFVDLVDQGIYAKTKNKEKNGKNDIPAAFCRFNLGCEILE